MAKHEFINTGKWAIVNLRAGEAQLYIKRLLGLPENVWPVTKCKCPPRAWGSSAPLRRQDYTERNEMAAAARALTGTNLGCYVAVPLDQIEQLRIKDKAGVIVGFA